MVELGVGVPVGVRVTVTVGVSLKVGVGVLLGVSLGVLLTVTVKVGVPQLMLRVVVLDELLIAGLVLAMLAVFFTVSACTQLAMPVQVKVPLPE
jgi:hypothetical protein